MSVINSNQSAEFSQRVTDAAKRILSDCPWESTVRCVLDYAENTNTSSGHAACVNHQETIDGVDEYPNVEEWVNVMKATGGVIGIGWYHSEIGELVEYTVLDPVSNPSDSMTRVVVNESRLDDVSSEASKSNATSLPVYQPTGHPYLVGKIDADALTPIALTIGEVKNSLSVHDQQSFPLSTYSKVPLNIFDHQAPSKNWGGIDEYVPVTNPAKTLITQTPWVKPRNSFLAYDAANNPRDFIPTTSEWVKMLKVTGGQVQIAWYDTHAELIDTITYLAIETSQGHTRDVIELDELTRNEQNTDVTTKRDIRRRINESQLKPIAISKYSSQIIPPHAHHN